MLSWGGASQHSSKCPIVSLTDDEDDEDGEDYNDGDDDVPYQGLGLVSKQPGEKILEKIQTKSEKKCKKYFDNKLQKKLQQILKKKNLNKIKPKI